MSDLVATLQHLEKHPGMYFGDAQRALSIHILQAIILGFETAQDASGSPRVFDCFTEWVATRYRVLADGRNSFGLILERAGGDERKAFDEFFGLLPDYLRDRQMIGRDGIGLRFSKVQDEVLEAFRKGSKDQ